jgi:hypothetical protein
MVDNDNACFLNARGVLELIASKLAPTGLVKLVANSYNSTQGQRAFPHLAF